MKLLNFKVRHILGLKELDLDVSENHLILVGGKTGQGKTSTLNSLKMALCPKADMKWPDKVLHDGEDEGEVIVTLSGDDELHEPHELRVELKISQKRNGEIDKITIFDSAGEKAPTPRQMLKDLYYNRAFDPQAFERMDTKEQTETIAKLVGLDLEGPREEYKQVFDERTIVNREVKRLEGLCASLPHYPDAPDEEVDTEKLAGELEKVRLHNTALVRLQSSLQTSETAVTTKVNEIAKLEEQLAEAKAALANAITTRDTVKKSLADAGEEKDESPIVEKIKNASGTNTKVAANKTLEAERANLAQAKEQSEAFTKRLDEITKAAEKAIKSAKFPIPNMSIDKEGVLLNGRAFKDNSRRERIMASAEICIALNPKLRLMVFEEGSSLDVDALNGLDEILRKHNFQAIVELVTRSQEDEDRCAVVLEDGEAKK